MPIIVIAPVRRFSGCQTLPPTHSSAKTLISPIYDLNFLLQYKITNMQRCPYIHEMKERLLGEQIPMEPLPKKIPTPPPFAMDQPHHQQPVATIVRVSTVLLFFKCRLSSDTETLHPCPGQNVMLDELLSSLVHIMMMLFVVQSRV
jgi:hypothetical protein